MTKYGLFFLVSRNRGYTDEWFATLDEARKHRAVFQDGDILRCYGNWRTTTSRAYYRIVGVEAPEGELTMDRITLISHAEYTRRDADLVARLRSHERSAAGIGEDYALTTDDFTAEWHLSRLRVARLSIIGVKAEREKLWAERRATIREEDSN